MHPRLPNTCHVQIFSRENHLGDTGLLWMTCPSCQKCWWNMAGWWLSGSFHKRLFARSCYLIMCVFLESPTDKCWPKPPVTDSHSTWAKQWFNIFLIWPFPELGSKRSSWCGARSLTLEIRSAAGTESGKSQRRGAGREPFLASHSLSKIEHRSHVDMVYLTTDYRYCEAFVKVTQVSRTACPWFMFPVIDWY